MFQRDITCSACEIVSDTLTALIEDGTLFHSLDQATDERIRESLRRIAGQFETKAAGLRFSGAIPNHTLMSVEIAREDDAKVGDLLTELPCDGLTDTPQEGLTAWDYEENGMEKDER